MNFLFIFAPPTSDAPMKSICKSILKLKSKGYKGYTLIEVAIGVAILSVLVTVVVALVFNSIIEAKLTSATGSCQMLVAGITAFFSHTGEWPNASSLPRSKPINDDNSFQVLRSGANEGDEQLDPMIKDLGELRLWKVAAAKIGNINDQLLNDKIGYLSFGLNWKGPYINAVDQDPFGRNYLIYIRATYQKEEAGKPLYGWVLSAGPNETVETAPTDKELKGDDVGALVISNAPTH